MTVSPWSPPSEMADLLDALATAADRLQLSYSETAHIARNAAITIRHLIAHNNGRKSMDDDTIEGWLTQQIEWTHNAATESRQFAMNSYGAGYDRGRLDALKETLAKLTELWGETKG